MTRLSPEIERQRVQDAFRKTYPQADGLDIQFIPADEDTTVDQYEIRPDPCPGVGRYFIAFDGCVYTAMGEPVAQYSMKG